MTTARRFLIRQVLPLAAYLAPEDRRTEWRAEWASELWYGARENLLHSAVGLLADAWTCRRLASRPPLKSLWRSPWVLVAGAALVLATVMLTGLPTVGPDGTWRVLIGLACWTCILQWRRLELIGTSWRRRLVRYAFLLAKVTFAAILPSLIIASVPIGGAMLLGTRIAVECFRILVMMVATRLAAVWAVEDQVRRCPHCLRELDYPVTFESAAMRWLAPAGVEWVCPHGHGAVFDQAGLSDDKPIPHWLPLAVDSVRTD